MPTETMVGVEALLGQERWVRRLARALIHDADEAEDIVQETRLTSWRRPPRDPARVRSWLGTVVRNLVRNQMRAQGIRQRLEGQLDADAEAVPSAERLAERLEIHRALAEAVSQLTEPFREVVLLRYYEELSSAEIARRLEQPAGTIRWRLMTGLERLRAALDEQRGGRAAWLAALVPLVQQEERPPLQPPAAASGRTALALGGTLAVTLGLAAVAVIASRDRGSAHVAGPASARVGTNAGTRVTNRPLPVPPLVGASADPRSAADFPAWIQLEGAPPRTIAGRVLSNGRPLAGARLRLSSGTLTSARHLDRHAVSGDDGGFAFTAQLITDWFLTVWAPGLEPVVQYLDLRQEVPGALVDGHPIDALVVDLGPCRVFARGTVKDAGGGVLASARVRFAASWEGAGTEARTDGGGHYELCIPRASPHARVLTAEASGYGSMQARAPSVTGLVDFVLEPQGRVAGRALHQATGEPVAGVDVVLIPVPSAGPAPPPGERRQPARREGMTGEGGRFELTGIAPGRYTLRFAGDQAFGAAAGELTVASGEQLRGLEVTLSPVALVEGLAFRSGAPAAHVDLRFTPAPGPGIPGPRRTRSDAQGRFRLRVPQDLPLTLEIPADPDRPNARWIPITPSTFVPGKPYRDGLRIDLPPDAAPASNEFVTPPGASAPPPAHTVDARFGDQVRLLGYDLPTNHVARGGQLDVTLHFQALASTEGCRLFVHLVGPGPFTNLDHTPAQGTHPVPHWRPGETIRDRFTIPIPTNFPPGTYTLLTGFWRPAGNHRLPIAPPSSADGEARLRVLTFTVD